MKVQLSIKDDRELRAHIKDAIKGEVTSIARKEIRAIIKEVLTEWFKTSVSNSAESMIKSEIKEMVKKELGRANYGQPSAIKQMARKEINDMIRNKFEKGDII